MRFPLLSLLLFTASLFSAQSQTKPVEYAPSSSVSATPPEAKNFDLFLLVGQSNMAGRGEVTEADRVPDPRILLLSKDDQWVLQGQPYHFDKTAAGTGLAFTFSQELLKHSPGVTVGLIPSAVSGTGIELWQPGRKYYEEAVRRTKIAMKSGTLKGILWHQGEANSKTKEKAEGYEAALARVVEGFRRDLNAPDVPFIAGTLGDFLVEQKGQVTLSPLINEQIVALADKLPRMGIVSTAGLAPGEDNLHFNAGSLRKMGVRYYEVWSRVAAGEKPVPPKP